MFYMFKLTCLLFVVIIDRNLLFNKPHLIINLSNSIDFTKLSLIDLKKYCKDNGINGYSKMNKKTLIETIQNSTTHD